MKELKQNLRKNMTDIIKSLPDDYVRNADRLIAQHIIDSSLYKEADTIFTFVTMGREINMIPVIEHGIIHGKNICAPKCLSGGIMEARKINGLDEITESSKGIPEPTKDCPLIPKGKIDLIIVPCLAADMGGFRIGYGGGFYDRYLSDYKNKSLIVCREKQMVEEIPVDSFDVPAGYYVTEKGVNLSSPSFF